MNTLPVDAAEPASSHRDDPDPPNARPSADEAGPADPEPPEPAGEKPVHRASARSGDLAIGQSPGHPVTPSPDASGQLELTIDAADDVTCDIDFLWLDGHLRSVAIHLPLPIGRVSIRIVGDSEMTDLNRRFHGADETTDVLTFCPPPHSDPIDADIALCADEAARQSSARGHSLERELLLYALHGLLHCCGFDDVDDESFRAMHAEEDQILSAIGVGATFNPPAAPQSPEERRR